jgi:hypothetical protein
VAFISSASASCLASRPSSYLLTETVALQKQAGPGPPHHETAVCFPAKTLAAMWSGCLPEPLHHFVASRSTLSSSAACAWTNCTVPAQAPSRCPSRCRQQKQRLQAALWPPSQSRRWMLGDHQSQTCRQCPQEVRKEGPKANGEHWQSAFMQKKTRAQGPPPATTDSLSAPRMKSKEKTHTQPQRESRGGRSEHKTCLRQKGTRRIGATSERKSCSLFHSKTESAPYS